MTPSDVRPQTEVFPDIPRQPTTEILPPEAMNLPTAGFGQGLEQMPVQAGFGEGLPPIEPKMDINLPLEVTHPLLAEELRKGYMSKEGGGVDYADTKNWEKIPNTYKPQWKSKDGKFYIFKTLGLDPWEIYKDAKMTEYVDQAGSFTAAKEKIIKLSTPKGK
jgi:hypothetical protein